MREILFRGKTEDGKWEYGYPYEIYRNCHTRKVIAQPPDAFGKGKYTEIIDETLSQFTGVIDVNGKKVFEGDIVKFALDDEIEGETVIDYASIKYNSEHLRFYLDWVEFFETPLIPEDGKELEVVGNIYDNPELLGGADNE